MNELEYEAMIEETISNLTNQIHKAAERNSHKDIRYNYRYGEEFKVAYLIKGWEGFDFRPKFLEELKEVVEDPNPSELGDLGWVLAMMLDNLVHGEKEAGV